MKKIAGILEASLMIIIYCLILLAVVNCQFCADAPAKDFILEELHSTTSNNPIHLFSHTTQTSFLVGAVQNNLFSSSKSPSSHFSGVLPIEEIILGSAYFQYHRSLVNVLIRFRKTNLIFPFHYFW